MNCLHSPQRKRDFFFFYKCNTSKPNVAVKKGQRICTSKCQFFTASYDSLSWVIQLDDIKDQVRWNESQSLCPLLFPLTSGINVNGRETYTKSSCRKGPGALGGLPVEHNPAAHPHCKESQEYPGLHKERCQQTAAGDSFPVTRPWWGHTWSAASRSGFPVSSKVFIALLY